MEASLTENNTRSKCGSIASDLKKIKLLLRIMKSKTNSSSFSLIKSVRRLFLATPSKDLSSPSIESAEFVFARETPPESYGKIKLNLDFSNYELSARPSPHNEDSSEE